MRYVKEFFKSILNDVPPDLPKDCDFNSYTKNLPKREKLHRIILKNHKVWDKNFNDFFVALKEVDRCFTRFLESLNNLLISYLTYMTVYDSLTGLFNRNYMSYALNRESKRSRRYNTPLSLVMMDIDDFKLINDTYGHLVGDEVLKQVGYILKRRTRFTDIPIRYGGEEFLIILPHTDVIGARIAAERFRTALKQEISVENLTLRVTVSAGVVQVKNFDNPVEDIDRVDRAICLAKRHGKDRVVVLEDE